ncbi:MAG: hypothetical protein ACKV2O_06570 [Acidimicrobiales bacterium]
MPATGAGDAGSDEDPLLAVAMALPFGFLDADRWLDPEDPVVVALMGLSAHDDPDVRNWATFGLGTQVPVDGAAVRDCLAARLTDSHEDTRAEALGGLARRHAPGIVNHVRQALEAAAVGRLAVEAAALLRGPSLGATLAGLAEWWDVDVALLDTARQSCAPLAVEEEANLVAALVAAAERAELPVAVWSELLPVDTVGPELSAGSGVYALGPLLKSAGGSAEVAVGLMIKDLHRGP